MSAALPHLPLARLVNALEGAVPALAAMEAAEAEELQARALLLHVGSLYANEAPPDEQRAIAAALAAPAPTTVAHGRIAVTVIEGCTEAEVRHVVAELSRHADALRDKGERAYP